MITLAQPQRKVSRVVALTQKIFEPKGWLATHLKLEHRSQQAKMANAVARALTLDEPLLFEAGTGVGKSLAYLIPGIMHAVESNRPFVVSTHTKALQEQVQNKDLRICHLLFDAVDELEAYRGFNVAKLVGRSNYLCTSRLAHALSTKTELFPSQEQNDLETIAEWSTITREGIIEELNPQPSHAVWEWVSADSSLCSKKYCKPAECFYQKARANIREAQVVIVNHSLLFSLISAGASPPRDASGVLFPDDFIVLDEGHTVPDIATSHFGLGLSSAGVDLSLKMLYNQKRGKGLLSAYGTKDDLVDLGFVQIESERFFNKIYEKYLQEKDVIRLHEPDWITPEFLPALKRVSDRLGTLAIGMKDQRVQDELNDQRARLLNYYNGLVKAISLAEEDHVYWLERSGRRRVIVTIKSAPINIAPYLEDVLFKRKTAAILTSATMAEGDSMDRFCSRVGAVGEETVIQASPFDYENNVTINIARDAPLPGVEDKQLDIQYLVKAITYWVDQVKGGTLVLFTSYRDLQQVGRSLELLATSMGRPLFIQGEGLSRMELIKQFKESGKGILLGTESFWTGVDVPGPALSQIIITRLPFENPSHPVKQAKSEWVEKRGKSAFIELMLPDAIIKFRQGLGRLIRKVDDRGLITILDSRILKKQYGGQFLNVLPKCDYHRFDQSLWS